MIKIIQCIKNIDTFKEGCFYRSITDYSINQINIFDSNEMDIALDLERAKIYFNM